MSPAVLLTKLELGGANGIGRIDIVETVRRMKSRGFYETPGGTILAAALAASSLSHWTAVPRI